MNPDFGLKSNALTNWLFRAETDLLTYLFLYQRFFFVCVVSTASCVLLIMAKRFGHFDQPKIG